MRTVWAEIRSLRHRRVATVCEKGLPPRLPSERGLRGRTEFLFAVPCYVSSSETLRDFSGFTPTIASGVVARDDERRSRDRRAC